MSCIYIESSYERKRVTSEGHIGKGTGENCSQRLFMQNLVQFIKDHPWLSVSWLLLFILLIMSMLRRQFAKVVLIDHREAIRLINRASAWIVDVRDSQSFKKAHIAGAINITPEDLRNKKQPQLQRGAGHIVIVVCANGSQAPIVAEQLASWGFSALYALRDGLAGWDREHLPLVLGEKKQRDKKVEIYTRATCSYCIHAKELLKKLEINFIEIPVKDDVTKAEMIKRSGRKSVPQIFIDGKHIGGCDDLYALHAQGALLP